MAENADEAVALENAREFYSIIDKVKLITLTCSKNSQDINPYKTDPALKWTKVMIQKFYKQLTDLLHHNHFLWND